MRIKVNILILLLLSVSSIAFAQQLKLAELFNDGVVLQRNSKVEIWGTSQPGQSVTVEILDKKYKTISNENGSWALHVSPMKAGGPYKMSVSSGNETLQLNEVYVGEVWIAGGQSNMGWTLDKSLGGKEEIAEAKNKNIRFVLVPVVNYEGEKVRGDMNWRTATTENVGPMSGVAYYFAKQMQEKLNVPIGIICCYKGGTAAEVWMSRETLLHNPDHAPIVTSYENYLSDMGKENYDQLFSVYQKELKIYFDSVRAGHTAIRPVEPMGEKHYKRPYGLYNTMVKRIIPYTAKGFIWYQGEANATRSEQYRTLFPALVAEWRSDFKNPKMPFLFVQLANYNHPSYGNKPVWAELREAQLLTWQKVKNTGMTVSMDVGDKNDIHPTNKKPVGERLAANALNTVYGEKMPYSGPVYKSVKFKDNKAILNFNFVYSGLTSEGELKGFSICDTDGKFVAANAKIAGNQIIVSSPEIKKPVAVRYSWSNWSEGNLKNKEGFPATPFRTDNFELITAGVKAPKY
jgi:sialate O-acetylesterase